MSTEFSFRLLGVDAPDGELEIDHLIALVTSLKEIATKISRVETAADVLGRPPRRTQDVARLTIGLAPGSTKLVVQRLQPSNILDTSTEEETSFDEQFETIVTSLADDHKPEWVSDPLAVATEKFRTALEKTAQKVEFSAGGVVKRTFSTADTHSQTWSVPELQEEAATVDFVGRLRAVNLDTDRLWITDDVSTKVVLRDVTEAQQVGGLLDKYVTASGRPVRDDSGKLKEIIGARITPMEDLYSVGVKPAVPLEEILASAPGPEEFKITDLTHEEMQNFWEALG